ncbi:hypothetical protein KCU88_g65, partial [Aureobasidium melanogenum]
MRFSNVKYMHNRAMTRTAATPDASIQSSSVTLTMERKAVLVASSNATVGEIDCFADKDSDRAAAFDLYNHHMGRSCESVPEELSDEEPERVLRRLSVARSEWFEPISLAKA